jgi:hypothetical protein
VCTALLQRAVGGRASDQIHQHRRLLRFPPRRPDPRMHARRTGAMLARVVFFHFLRCGCPRPAVRPSLADEAE